jgi:hypothetical protein
MNARWVQKFILGGGAKNIQCNLKIDAVRTRQSNISQASAIKLSAETRDSCPIHANSSIHQFAIYIIWKSMKKLNKNVFRFGDNYPSCI